MVRGGLPLCVSFVLMVIGAGATLVMAIMGLNLLRAVPHHASLFV